MKIQDAKNLVVSLNASRVCNSCGQEDKWLVPQKPSKTDEAAIGQLIIQGTDMAMSFLPLICTGCGNTRFYQLDYAHG